MQPDMRVPPGTAARDAQRKPDNLFPYFLDPLRGLTSSDVLANIKLHLLLCEAITVQDNFLISRLLAEVREPTNQRSPFCGWIERGWVKVALRDSTHSLLDLKRQLNQKALVKDYRPFEGYKEGLTLYRSRKFGSYLKDIDACLPNAGLDGVLTWNTREMGRRFRTRMKASAELGSAGLRPEEAMAVWAAIDARARGDTHSRTMYDALASETVDDEARAASIRRWAGIEYIKNLPTVLGLGVSLPRTVVAEAEAWDPLSELASVDDIQETTIRNCDILRRDFLTRLSLQDMEQLRGLKEFKALAEARNAGDPDRLRRSLLAYLQALSDAGPRIANSRIRDLEVQVRFRRRAVSWMTIAGLSPGYVVGLVARVVPSLSANAETLEGLGVALSTFALLLGHSQDLEKALEREKLETAITLKAQRLGSGAFSLGDFHHG